MSITGIVRKIDGLGRIVLPKELRSYLNINPGDDFQIIVENEKIILEKYSKLLNYKEEILKIIESFKKNTNLKIYLAIDNKLIITDELINVNIIKQCQPRKRIVSAIKEKIVITKNIIEYGNYVIEPLIINSDLLGILILVGEESINILNTITNIIKSLINNYFVY